MVSRSFPAACLLLLFSTGCHAGHAGTRAPHELVVCADPNNLPSSNDRLQGYENHLAQLVAQDMGVPLRFYWLPERRGFVRNTLKSGKCNVIMGVPAAFELADPTIPYYRSTYVFVYRRDRGLAIHSLDDPRLHTLKIGVHVIGADYTSLPPVAALARRNVVQNVVGFSIYGDYSEPNPPARLIDAVANGDVDVAIAWGPLAGYFASRESRPLVVAPIDPLADGSRLPLAFDIAMAVHHGDDPLRTKLNEVITRRRADIDHLLQSYGVPLLP